MNSQLVRIHIADDDPDDRLLISEALEEINFENHVSFSVDGQDLLDYLLRQGDYSSLSDPLPDIILLDLNMPRKDGREALREIKKHDQLRQIPVIILTTSQAEEDILSSYDLGSNSFIVKPLSFENMVEAISKVTDYWFKIVKLPRKP